LASCPTDVVDPRTNNNGAEKFWNCADIEVRGCFGPGCTTVAHSSTVMTTSSSTLVPTTATWTLSAYCNHEALQVACCFCQGGVRPATTTNSAPCADSALPVAWSGGGVHTCATYNNHGGSQYCAHNEIKAACCFCGGGAGGILFSSLSSPTGDQQPMLSCASVFATWYLAVAASFFLPAELLA